ncbi:MAG: hypothetical protein JWP87_3862 [Labilithrix sp.]|nr:hypothetical protein [Labilithrix sp.]
MTRKVIAILMGLALAACSKDRSDHAGTTTTTGASDKGASVEDVRMVLVAERPDATAAINALQITNANGVVTLRGQVDDEGTKKALVERVKKMPGVKDVKDELGVIPERIKVQGAPPGQQRGTAPAAPTKTPRTDAIRSELSKDPKAKAVVNEVVITDDGSVIVVSGTVPDQATHDAVIRDAKKAPGVRDVKDNLQTAKK